MAYGDIKKYTVSRYIYTETAIPNLNNNQPTPPQSGRGMVGSDRYGFYAGLIPPQTNTLAGSKPPQGAGY
jgi:hypothetical protein